MGFADLWQGKELQADNLGQKPAKHGVCLEVWQGKDLAGNCEDNMTEYTPSRTQCQ